VTELVDSPAGVEVRLAEGSAVRTERLVVAAGRRPRSDRGGVAEAGIELERGWIVTGRDLATSARGVYAAGDITGKSPFTHAADAMGRTAAANVLRTIRRARFDPALVASVTFTRPEVARVGLTEAEAAATVEGALVAELPLSEHDRAVAAGTTDGYIKLIAGPRPFIGNAGGGRLIGATVVAERAGEIIAELALAMRLNAFVFRLAQTIHPYPTWSYAIPKVAAQFLTTIGGRTARPARGAPG
jgi:pyruvate/2-oxoglutarate dehydrogenase complex dihydrolipoamide dehydrogenase (E3) component